MDPRTCTPTSCPSRRSPRSASEQPRGQALAEFALVIPILLLLVIGIGDFGRLYTSAVAVEASAREAADYGSFKSSYWNAGLGNPPITAGEMERRACTAAWGSHLEGYAEPAGTVNHATCTNPTFTCRMKPSDGSPDVDCATYSGSLCSDSTTDPPCDLQVTMHYVFRPFFDVSILGWGPPTITLDRTSTFRISDLPS